MWVGSTFGILAERANKERTKANESAVSSSTEGSKRTIDNGNNAYEVALERTTMKRGRQGRGSRSGVLCHEYAMRIGWELVNICYLASALEGLTGKNLLNRV